MNRSKNGQHGFTLVELAIVLMIIGLLIGGILRGQELMENARIASTVQQVKAYQGATVTFRDAYAAAPGDMFNAVSRVPGCTAANFCGNGNGDGVIGVGIANNTVNLNQAGTTTAPQVETSYFWKHLATAHMISGVNPSSDPTKAEWGSTAPTAKIGGGFTVFYMLDAGGGGDKGRGLNLRLQNSVLSDGWTDRASGGGALSPISAGKIDRKMDDGLGDSGDVTGDHEDTCDPGGNYMVSETKTCYMYFSLGL